MKIITQLEKVIIDGKNTMMTLNTIFSMKLIAIKNNK